MTVSSIRIATRESPLALWQANHVKQRIQQLNPAVQVELLSMKTSGDRFLSAPLSQAGGKGLFMKELEQCLLNGEADIAVHSMKDVTVAFPEGLHLQTILVREDARDAFISNDYDSIESLPQAAIVGTSSMRRRCQLLKLRPDLQIRDLRGNVGTRLGKLDNAEYDAIILAMAGVKRLGLESRVRQAIPLDQLIPAIGQGAVGIESRIDNTAVNELLAALNDSHTQQLVEAERIISRRLYGGCQLPLAAHACDKDGMIDFSAVVGRLDGTTMLFEQASGKLGELQSIAHDVADRLLQRGADKILSELIHD